MCVGSNRLSSPIRSKNALNACFGNSIRSPIAVTSLHHFPDVLPAVVHAATHFAVRQRAARTEALQRTGRYAQQPAYLGTFQPFPAKAIFCLVPNDLFKLLQHFPLALPEVFTCDDVYFHIPIIMFPYPYIPLSGY